MASRRGASRGNRRARSSARSAPRGPARELTIPRRPPTPMVRLGDDRSGEKRQLLETLLVNKLTDKYAMGDTDERAALAAVRSEVRAVVDNHQVLDRDIYRDLKSRVKKRVARAAAAHGGSSRKRSSGASARRSAAPASPAQGSRGGSRRSTSRFATAAPERGGTGRSESASTARFFDDLPSTYRSSGTLVRSQSQPAVVPTRRSAAEFGVPRLAVDATHGGSARRPRSSHAAKRGSPIVRSGSTRASTAVPRSRGSGSLLTESTRTETPFSEISIHGPSTLVRRAEEERDRQRPTTTPVTTRSQIRRQAERERHKTLKRRAKDSRKIGDALAGLDTWEVLREFDSLKVTMKHKAEKVAQRQAEEAYRKEIDKQLVIKRRQLELQRLDERELERQMELETRKAHAQIRARQREKKKLDEAYFRETAAERDRITREKDLAFEIRVAEERELVEDIQKQIEIEKKRKKEDVKRIQQANQEVLQANKQLEDEKRRRAERERQEELESSKLFRRALERHEVQRRLQLQEHRERYLPEPLDKMLRDQAALDKTLKEQQQKEERERDLENLRQTRIEDTKAYLQNLERRREQERKNKETREVLDNQVQIRKLRAEEEKKEDAVFCRKLKSAIEKEKRLVEKDKKKEAARIAAYRRELAEQLYETRQRTDPLNVPITDAELEVNKDRLRAIAENPTLVNVIRRRLENAEHFDETVGTKEPLMAAT